MNSWIVSPAYGRDYKSGSAAREDFLTGKDFVNEIPTGGHYCSVRDFPPGTEVEIRYKRKTQLVIVTVPDRSSEVC